MQKITGPLQVLERVFIFQREENPLCFLEADSKQPWTAALLCLYNSAPKWGQANVPTISMHFRSHLKQNNWEVGASLHSFLASRSQGHLDTWILFDILHLNTVTTTFQERASFRTDHIGLLFQIITFICSEFIFITSAWYHMVKIWQVPLQAHKVHYDLSHWPGHNKWGIVP